MLLQFHCKVWAMFRENWWPSYPTSLSLFSLNVNQLNCMHFFIVLLFGVFPLPPNTALSAKNNLRLNAGLLLNVFKTLQECIWWFFILDAIFFFFLRCLVKLTTPWMQQSAVGRAEERKGSELNSKMLGCRRGTWQLFGFRSLSFQKALCVNAGQVCSTCIDKNLIYVRELWLFLPRTSCIYQHSSLYFLINWLLFWHVICSQMMTLSACVRMSNSFTL